jgi:hypothetical protein
MDLHLVLDLHEMDRLLPLLRQQRCHVAGRSFEVEKKMVLTLSDALTSASPPVSFAIATTTGPNGGASVWTRPCL